jgi:hypothetical protein
VRIVTIWLPSDVESLLDSVGCSADEEAMNPSDRDRWNDEAVLMALQPWELDVIERGLTCLAALAAAQPDWDHVGGQESRAMAVVGKLNQVLEYQGYEGGFEGLRSFLDEQAEPESSGF